MTMAPYDPQDLQPWQDLARQWEHLGATWLGWWQQAANLPGLPPGVGLPPVVPRGRRGCRGARRAECALPASLPGIGTGGVAGAGDRGHAARTRTVRRQAIVASGRPHGASSRIFAFLKQAYLLYAEYVTELAQPRAAVRNRQAPPRVRDTAIPRRHRAQQFSGDQSGRAARRLSRRKARASCRAFATWPTMRKKGASR